MVNFVINRPALSSLLIAYTNVLHDTYSLFDFFCKILIRTVRSLLLDGAKILPKCSVLRAASRSMEQGPPTSQTTDMHKTDSSCERDGCAYANVCSRDGELYSFFG